MDFRRWRDPERSLGLRVTGLVLGSAVTALCVFTALREPGWFGLMAWLVMAAGSLVIAIGWVVGIQIQIDEDRDTSRTMTLNVLVHIVYAIILMVLWVLGGVL